MANTLSDTPTPSVGNSVLQQKKRRKLRNIAIWAVVLVLLAVGGTALYRFLTAREEAESTLQTQPAMISSIQSTVQGSGSARSKESAAITLTQGGTVEEVLVTAGDVVTAGQPLYTIRSADAEEAVATAQERVDLLRDDLDDLHKTAGKLTIRAPFAGKLVEVTQFQVDQRVSAQSAVATLVNDKKLKLTLYFSYAYERNIAVGQMVEVSIPAVMGSFRGEVEELHKVRYITPEGAVCFEVVAVFDNPGTLTQGMAASAALTAADGTPIYPYQNGETEYYETRSIVAEATGPVISYDLLRYADVAAGQVLLTLGSDTIDADIRAKQKEVEEAEADLDSALRALGNFNAAAPIDGVVTTCTLLPEAEVKAGDTVIIISNTTTMLVDITVDDRNISFVKPGMTVDLTDWNGNVFMGVVSSINTGGAQSGQGMTSYPVILTVDNFGGGLMEGVWLDYSFVTSQSDDCVVVPMQSVKYVSDENGETYAVVFIRAEERPEGSPELDIPEPMPGEVPAYPSADEGFYPVQVETGLSDSYNVEIRTGLAGDEEVFVNYYVEQAWG